MTLKVTSQPRIFVGREGMIGTNNPGINKTTLSYLYPGFRNGTSNPNWKSVIRSGGQATTYLEAERTDIEWTPHKWRLLYDIIVDGIADPQEVFCEGLVDLISFEPPNAYSSADDDEKAEAFAIQQFYRRIQQRRSQFGGGLALMEAKKTLDMIAKPSRFLMQEAEKYVRKSKKLSSGIKKMMTKDRGWISTPTGRKEKVKINKDLRGLYLESVFGWQPLLLDIRDAAKALVRLQLEKRLPERFRVYGQVESLLSTSSSLNLGYGRHWYNYHMVNTGRTIVVYYGAIKDSATTADASKVVRASELLGVSMKDFIPTIWEYLPWSFAVDYFVNIGDVLGALCTDTSGITRISRVSIHEHEVRITTRSDDARNKSYWEVPSIGTQRAVTSQFSREGRLVKTRRAIVRTPSSVPVLWPRIELPDVWSKHMLNLSVLFAQGVRR